MSNILVYTFRTYPEIAKLEEMFGKVFVFAKLKNDLEKFKKIVVDEKPELVLGVAKANEKSRIESLAVNRFNRTKSIIKNGPESYPFSIPDIDITISKTPTDSFCNWTAYQIANYIDTKKLNANLSFIHLNSTDLELIHSLIL